MDTIRASIIDGIAINARFRERTLSALHRGIETSRPEIIAALHDGVARTTQIEAEAQYIMTLNAIRDFHRSTNPKESLKQEYRPAKSQDDTHKRSPIGYAYILTPVGDPLYSLVVPVAAAIAAGNCVLIEEAEALSSASRLIRRVLEKSLTSETVLFTTKDPFEEHFQHRFRISVQQNLVNDPWPTGLLLSAPAKPRVAIVDRSGNVQNAARACAYARFGFAGASSYAPDLVLVNEFHVEEFAQAARQAALSFQAAQNCSGTNKTDKQESSGNVVTSTDRATVVILEKNDKHTLSYVDSPVLKILPVSSGEACINMLNKHDSPLLVNYIFADPATAKYLSQFVQASISIINHIPAEILIGPVAPAGHPTCIHPRYTPDMFSVASPVIVEQPESSIDQTLWPGKSSKKAVELDKWLQSSIEPVKEPFGPTVGFFEQGLLFGVGVILTSVVVSCSLAIRYGYPVVVRTLTR
ncbi:Fatty aldehyde dehydrogenase [Cyphellophora attinorum]|uniref:Fatty aldehyde dehydrogenase n=1 Tax=Cyphellophora attinorum TaxID=1664694 RepID=A0A0N1GXH6_9EURO|nr:Fatty aldehyde dehydrogenase [Phialophora attinorum]KPI35035.1 Fatty aldehyde dehydrogenase [Phialophora attinorum]